MQASQQLQQLHAKREWHLSMQRSIQDTVRTTKEALADAECRQRIVDASLEAYDFAIGLFDDADVGNPWDNAVMPMAPDPVVAPKAGVERTTSREATEPKTRRPKRDLHHIVLDAINSAGPDGITHRALAKDLKILHPRLEEIVLVAVEDHAVVVVDQGTSDPVIVAAQYLPQEPLDERYQGDVEQEDAAE